MSGYFQIGIYQGKTEPNIGTLWRSAYQLGASGIFTIGKRYTRQSSDTYKSERQIPLVNYRDFDHFLDNRPVGSQLIGVEMGGVALREFKHPKTAIYLLGSEDNGLPNEVRAQCQHIVSIESINTASYNVAVAGSLVMYSRMFMPWK
jgi:tRNA G18 (ribose-2'-O)-methylase SpoU